MQIYEYRFVIIHEGLLSVIYYIINITKIMCDILAAVITFVIVVDMLLALMDILSAGTFQ